MTVSLDIDRVKARFPAPSYRKYQEKTIEAMVKILNKRYVCVLDGPVGFGKSYVLMAIASAVDGGAFYVTPQNLLIEQLVEDRFLQGKLEHIKGRRHYKCPYDGSSCDVAPCKRKKGFECSLKYANCPYWGQKMRAAAHQVCVTNFSYLIAEGFIPDEAQCPTLGKRDILIVDEGHNIGEVANDFISCTISRRTVPPPLHKKIISSLVDVSKTAKTFDDIKSYIDKIHVTVEEEMMIYADGDMSERRAKEYEKILELAKKIHTLLEDEEEWVFQFEPDDQAKKSLGWVKLIMKPLKPDRFMKVLLWKRAKKVIISSGTPPIYPGAMADIGLATRSRLAKVGGRLKRIKGTSDYKTVHVPSIFPVENRPIVDRRVGLMTRKGEQKTLPKAINEINKILFENYKHRGIIHANSYRHAQLLMSGLDTGNIRRLVFHTSEDRNDVLKQWLNGEFAEQTIDDVGVDSTVLVAVSMEEGLDLKDDMARFQILFKVMYPSLGDKRVSRRLELGEDAWYSNLTLIKVIQSYGRAVRGVDDWAKYYVVDSSFYRLFNKMQKYLPPWFSEAVENGY